MTYRRPADLDPRPVLVVGASATGVQLAEEIHLSGRPVTLAVGEHVRLPRTYRGRDVFWWLDRAGVLDERDSDVDDLARARRVPSPQLVGSPQQRVVDLNSLAELGVRVVGRLAGVASGMAQFSGSLANTATLADLKMNRLLTRFDDWARVARADVGSPERPAPTRVPGDPILQLDLGEFGTVVWATGFRPDHSWLDLPVLDRRGRVRHRGGVVEDVPGLYLLGANLLRRRRSSYISGAESDSAELVAELHTLLDGFVGGAMRCREMSVPARVS